MERRMMASELCLGLAPHEWEGAIARYYPRCTPRVVAWLLGNGWDAQAVSREAERLGVQGLPAPMVAPQPRRGSGSRAPAKRAAGAKGAWRVEPAPAPDQWAPVIVALWRSGQKPQEIATRLGFGLDRVERAIEGVRRRGLLSRF